ncbi:MAG TPA: PhoX family phosphatase [Dehalococcoidia bacterium]|nr:PhoX family phosphatase [Dehalococcoidia bacterium]
MRREVSVQDDDTVSNPSTGRTFESILEANISRRRVLQGGIGLATAAFLGLPLLEGASVKAAAPGFKSVPPSKADAVVVPAGYTAKVLYAWGDPVSNGPAFKQDASNAAWEQEHQAGMHHDGMHFFPLGANWGLLAINHEYTDDGLLHVGGMVPWTADKVKKSQAAHGVSVIEVRLEGKDWIVVRPSAFARRITANTPIAISGPAAGSAFVKTAGDPAGTRVLGTINNCAHGSTPWGTYLTCEENFNGYFSNETGTITNDQKRYGINKGGFGYRWHEFDERFRADLHPNEPNRFGWVAELDPYSPYREPVKRTALGRIKHEGAETTLAKDGRAVVYMGDDERNEYIYKFVSAGRYAADNPSHNRDLLDSGTLYVARFNDDGSGAWLPIVYGQGGLTSGNGFSSQAEVLVRTRQAADLLGATMMDRPEWIAVHPTTKEVYCTLTNNSNRGTTPVSTNTPSVSAGSARPPVDKANPRGPNTYGHIIRWREAGGDPGATTFVWDIFVLAGDADLNAGNAAKSGNIKGDKFGSPDGLWFDYYGMLWIQTDISTSTLNSGDYAQIGNNMMLAADTASGEIRRFLTGPPGCEVTGVTTTADGKTMFVNIQHPGEPASERNDPAKPTAVSTWPDGPAAGRPRAATVVIRKDDGGLIGT